MQEDIIVEERSMEMQNILGKVPSWTIRFGISLFFAIILLVILFSILIRYPEIIVSKISIINQDPPVSIISQTNGKIIKLFVKNNQLVKEHETLAIIENTSEVNDVLAVKALIDSIKQYIEINNEIPKFNLIINANLGDLQIEYLNFKQYYLDYLNLIDNNYENIKITALEKQIEYHDNLNFKLEQLREIKNKEYKIEEDKYENEKTLYSKGLLSELDLRNAENNYLEKQLNVNNSESNILNNKIQQTEFRKNIMDLKQQYNDKKRSLIISIQDAINKFYYAYSQWEQRYVLKSPVGGVVSFYKYFKEYQYVNINNEVMSIVPVSQDYDAKLYLAISGSGKVKIGQKVNIKLDNYPYNEFGMVDGLINAISLVQKENTFLVYVALPNKLTTNYNKRLEYIQDMTGTAEIITDDLSLFERMFNKLRSILIN